MGKKSIKAKTRSSFCVEKREKKEPSFFAFTLLHTLAWDNKIIAHTHTHTHTQCLSVLYTTRIIIINNNKQRA